METQTATAIATPELDRLEAIVKQLEQGELPLEQTIGLFEEATKLNKELGARLEAVERRIEILTSAADGSTKAEPFEPDQEG